MANSNPSRQAAAAMTISLNGLASAAAAGRSSAAVTPDTLDVDHMVQVGVGVGAGTIANDKCAYVYVYATFDSTNYRYSKDGVANEVDGTDKAVDLGTPTLLLRIVAIPIPIQSKPYSCQPFSIAALFDGKMPTRYGIVVQNYSGIAFDSSNNWAQYTPVRWSIG